MNDTLSRWGVTSKLVICIVELVVFFFTKISSPFLRRKAPFVHGIWDKTALTFVMSKSKLAAHHFRFRCVYQLSRRSVLTTLVHVYTCQVVVDGRIYAAFGCRSRQNCFCFSVVEIERAQCLNMVEIDVYIMCWGICVGEGIVQESTIVFQLTHPRINAFCMCSTPPNSSCIIQ